MQSALGGRGLFAFANEGEPRLFQRRLKEKVPFGGFLRLPPELLQRQAGFLLLHPLPRVGGQLVQDVHASTSGRLLTSISRCRVSRALPESSSRAARAMPSCMVSALPPM